jgi:hypothetical protein
MARTTTDKRISQKRRAKGVLVPILEDLLESTVEVEDEEDVKFVADLLRRQAVPREKGVFSPSMLGSCVRQAYFSKIQFERRPAVAPQTNAIFLDGGWRHVKWQFALWKAHRAGTLELIGCEIRVHHPNGDFAGTIDAIVKIDGLFYVVDFKGMHLFDFQKFMNEGIFVNHAIQIAGYGMIVTLNRLPVSAVEACLLVAESKAGPTDRSSPIGLHEYAITVRSMRSQVKRRLALLREYVDNEEIPPPACVSTKHKQFQECDFSWYCRREVKAIQAKREAEARRNDRKLSVAKSRRR